MPTDEELPSTESPIDNEENADGSRELLRALFLCLVAVVVVRSFLFEPFKIPSSSMLPTLAIGDHIVVSKFSFGLTIPFTKFELFRWGAPKRGDVVVFLFPKDESLHYIKRVVGIPGDRVEFRGRDLLINGELVQKEEVLEPASLAALGPGGKGGGVFYRERLGDATHFVRYASNNVFKTAKDAVPEVIPADSYFMIGDNRDDSYDSRSWGYVSRENIKGKAQLVLLSLDPDRGWGGLGNIRWSRCGTLIH